MIYLLAVSLFFLSIIITEESFISYDLKKEQKKGSGVILFPISGLPEYEGHDKSHGREHVAHGTRERRRCKLQAGIVEVLVNHWPAN